MVHDIAVIDGLAIGRFVAEAIEGLAHGDVGRQGDVVGGHDRAGGSGLVAGQPANIVALGLGEVGKHDIDEVFIEPVDQVGPFVVRHVVQQFGRLLRWHGLDEPILAFGIQIAQDLGAVARQQDPEQRIAVLGLQILD